MTDLDLLLRDTLHGRAATVTDAPSVATGTARDRRFRWLPVAATVAAVLVAGGGVAVRGLGRGGSGQHAGGGYARTCAANLPAAWKDALAGPRFSVDGHDTSVVALTPYGDVVSWTTGGLHLVGHIGLRASNGTTRELFAGAPDDSISTSVDGANLVLSVAPEGAGAPTGPNVQDIVAIDLRTSALRHLLPTAGMPTGDVVGDRAAVVLDGLVYWTAVPRGIQTKASYGTVLGYDLGRHQASVVARHASLDSAEDEHRGVFWTGGGVAARNVPTAVPTFEPNGLNLAVTDGRNFAWALGGSPQVVGWADAHGDARQATADSGTRRSQFLPIAVSGPFAFFTPSEKSDPTIFVLDTRTDALADSGVASTAGGSALGSRLALGTRVDGDRDAAVLVDTAHLPELRCR